MFAEVFEDAANFKGEYFIDENKKYFEIADEAYDDIEDFGGLHLDWFQSKGILKSGLPVHDTIARILSRLDPDEFHQCFANWMADVTQSLDTPLIAIDGKTLRQSYNQEDRQSCIHMVSAFASTNSLVLGQVKTETKSNEIKAIPELLQLLDIKGCSAKPMQIQDILMLFYPTNGARLKVEYSRS